MGFHTGEKTGSMDADYILKLLMRHLWGVIPERHSFCQEIHSVFDTADGEGKHLFIDHFIRQGNRG